MADTIERLATCARQLLDAAAEIERLHDQAVEDRKLSFEWMKKHDHLLGFIQKHPPLLKELIEENIAASGDGETPDQEKT